MASDNAIYQGRFRTSNKRSLLSTASRGPSGSAGRRCLERPTASVSSNSYNSAPALLQRYGESSTRRLRSSSDWQDGTSTEQDKGLSESPDASYASAASDDDESPQPRRSARKKQHSQHAQQEHQYQQQAAHLDHHSMQQQMMMMHMPMGYAQQHSMQDWHSDAYSAAVMQYPLQSSDGCADPSSMMQQSTHMLGVQHHLAGGYASQAPPHDRSRLGQTAEELRCAGSAGAPAAAPVPGWQQGYGGSAPQQAATDAAPGWQQQGSPPAGQQQLSTQGFPAVADLLPAWHAMPAAVMQEYKPAGQLQDYKPAGQSAWQCSSMSTPAQQLLSTLSSQDCASVGAVPGWQQQQEFAAAHQQQCVPSSTHALPAAANSGNGWQLGSMAATQQLATAGTQGYAAPVMAPGWQQAGSVMQPQQGTGSCSIPMAAMQLSPPIVQSAGLPASTQGGTVPLTVQLWNFAGGVGGSGNTLLQQNIQPLQPQQNVQLQQSTIGHVGWPAAAPQPSFPQGPMQPQAQAASAPPAQHPVGGPSASYIYLQGAMAAQAAHMQLQQQQQQAGGCGVLQQQAPAASAADHDGPTQTLCSQAQQVPPDPALLQQSNSRPDWLDVLACSEDMDGADDVARMCLSCEAAPAASTAPHAHAPRLPGGMLQEGLLAGALAAAPAGGASVSTDIDRCFSPEACLLDVLDDAGDGDLPSEEVDALLDQALDDLFHVHPSRAMPVCCNSSPRAAVGPAGLGESLPCTSTTCDGQV